MICLPEAQVLRSMDAEVVEPMCVTITIVDDDCKILLFAMFIVFLTLIMPHIHYLCQQLL